MNEHEAAERLGLSVGFLRKDRRGARLIPYVKLNKAVRYRCVDLEQALARHLMGAKGKG